jgi:hypothetical protein
MIMNKVYFYKKKTNRLGKEYIVVTQKPALVKTQINGVEFYSRVRDLRYGLMNISSLAENFSFEMGEIVPGFRMTDEAIDGYDHLYKVVKDD